MKSSFRHRSSENPKDHLVRMERPQLITGLHTVQEALIHGRIKIKELWINEGRKPGRIEKILQLAQERRIPVHFKKSSDITRLLPDLAHQGIVAIAEEFVYSSLNEIVETSLSGEKEALIVAADHITDEGNLGALIRTAAFFGAQGLILPRDRSAGVSPKVLKRASGAHISLPVARVVNLGNALGLLRKRGFWVIGASGEGSVPIYRFDWNRDVVLVLGNEQQGLSKTVRKRCHEVVSVPASGQVESLNVAVAGGVILSEIFRQQSRRQGKKGSS